MTIQKFISDRQLTFTAVRVGKSNVYRCRLTQEDRGMNFYHAASEMPTLQQALTRLVAVARKHQASRVGKAHASRDVESYLNWCSLYGEISRADYLTIRRTSEKLRYVLGRAVFTELLSL
jgi:hypothetical protein